MKIRKSLVVIHRWMSLGAGAFWLVAALTGGVLVFGPEINRAVNGGRFGVIPSGQAPASLDRVLAEQFPNATIGSLQWLHEDHVIRMDFDQGGQRRTVFLDATTGSPVEDVRPRTEIVAAVQRLHVTLLAGRIGNRLVTLTSAVTALSMLAGIVLWWPGIRAVKRGFVVRLRRGAYILNFDLHRSLGAVTVVLLLLMTGTGVIMGSPRVSRRLAVLLFPAGSPQPIPAAQQPMPLDRAPNVDEFAAIAETAVPGQIRSLEFPARMPDRALARVRPDPDRPATVQVYLARSDGRILAISRPEDQSPQNRFGQFNSRLHTGSFPSMTVRVMYSLACFLGVVLALTGFVLWWMKRTRTKGGGQQRPGTTVLASPDRPAVT